MIKKITKWFTTPVRFESLPTFRAQEIWWSKLEESEGPVLVFRKLNTNAVWALPLTLRTRGLYVIPHGKGTLSRLRIVDAKHLVRRLGKMSGKQFATLNARVLLSLQETDPLRPRTAVVKRTPTPMPIRTALPRYTPRPMALVTPRLLRA